jgi:phage terminase large subunit-like protein
MNRIRSDRCLTTDYAKDVIAGRVVASLKVKQACERHMSDLKRSKKRDYPWRFDEVKAHAPIKFGEAYCKPSQGEFEEIVFEPWDHFILGSLFGWVHKKTGLRRFREGIVFVARKNFKSGVASVVSLYCCSKLDDERGARVYQLANSMKQARESTFNECAAMVETSTRLKKSFRPLRDAIHYDATRSKIMPLASDSDNLDGLNCHVGVFDEIHEYKTYKLINVIKNSTSARRQWLLLYITTAGYVLDGPLMDMYDRGADVLDGIISDERTFYYMAELDPDDEVTDPENWQKANPNMGVSVHLDAMLEEWEKRKDVPAERNDFITKRLNVFVCSDEQPFITKETLEKNRDSVDVESLLGKVCVGGFDLSNTEDFTAAHLEFPLEDGRFFELSHTFVPEVKVKLDNEHLEWGQLVANGHVTVCEGPYVDYRKVFDWFVEKARLYRLLVVTFDPANAYRLVGDLQAYGGQDWTKVVRQGSYTLSPALKDIKECLLSGRIVSNDDPMLRWYLNNVKLVEDRNGNWLPTKQGRYRKIDGFAAWLNAHTEAMGLRTVATGSETPVTFISRRELTA